MSTELTTATPQQAAWLGLAARKNTTVAELEKRELALQSILLNVDNKAETLKDYRSAYAGLQSYRKDFTGMIDAALVQPLMAYEKRADPKSNEQYKALEAAELADRLELERARIKTMQAEQERNQFKAHILNEYERTVGELRIRMYTECKRAMQAGITDKKAIIATLETMQPLPLEKFVTAHLTIEEKTAIYNSIPKPSGESLIFEMIGEMERMQTIEQIDFVMVEAAQESADNMKINTMIARAAIVEVSKPKIKRNVEVVVDNTTVWATRIMGYFVSYDLYRYTRVKDVTKLTIAQMAKAIGEYCTENGEELEGLIYNEIVK
jgi:hypothetical protein